MTSVPKPKRHVNRELLDSYHWMRCVACGRTGCDPHHLISVKSGGPDSEFNVIPLCRMHHSECHQIGLYKFSAKHRKVNDWLVEHGWSADDLRLKWLHD